MQKYMFIWKGVLEFMRILFPGPQKVMEDLESCASNLPQDQPCFEAEA